MMPILDVQGQAYTLVDSGVELLTNGDFSAWTGAYPAEHPTGWSVTSPDTAANHLAQAPAGQCNLVSDGAFVIATQTVQVVGGNYSANSIVTAVASGSMLWGDDALTDQVLSPVTRRIQYVAASTRFAFKRAAACNVTTDSFSLHAMLAQTPNIGSLGSRLQMGDGITPASLPTRTPNTTAGFTFNGSQYLQWTAPITQNVFSYSALVMRTTAGANSGYLLDARAAGGTGYIWWSGVQLESSSGTIYVDDVPGIALPYGKLALVTCAGITLAAPSKIVLQAGNAFATPWVGNVLGQALVPGVMTPTQMRDMKYRLLARAFQ